jgi:hypothetical protein
MIRFEHNKVYTNIHDAFVWSGYKPADSTNVTLDAVAATAFAPAAPAVVVNVTQAQQ